MEYRRFGKTNLNFSVFSLGTMRCLASPKNVRQTLIQAVKLGINHIETASSYGKSEEYLGEIINSELPVSRSQIKCVGGLMNLSNASS